MHRIKKIFFDPQPFRTIVKEVIKKFEIGSYTTRFQMGAVERNHYAYCVYNAAVLAKRLNYARISVVEFGVAGGKGLLNLEYHARAISELFDIQIEIYGFDTGEGLPEPIDYRDLPYHWKEGFFKMDFPSLQKKLKTAKLVIGNISETSKSFFEDFNPAPIGAVMCDVDFYSSTISTLQMLEADEKYYLPRLFCYFDDTVGTEVELYGDFTGQRLAINEFNQNHDKIKLSHPYHLLAAKIIEPWFHQIWICHFFNHSRYNDFISAENQQLSINQ